MTSVLHFESLNTMIKHMKKQREWSQHFRLFVAYVFDMANGTCFKSGKAMLNAVH